MKILIADDHDIVRQGVRILLELQVGWTVCGEATTGREAIALAEKTRPDVAVLDMMMPDLNGLDAARQIKLALPQTEVLLFTSHENDESVRAVFEAGARGYILKSEANSQLVAAVKTAGEHKPFFTSKVSEILFHRFLKDKKTRDKEPGEERITPREREIVQLLAEGKSNKDVSSALNISVKTTETHRAAIMRKLKLKSFSAMVRYAIRNGIVEA